MKLPEIEVEYIGPIELGDYEHVTIRLPDGRFVKVFSDRIYIATEDDWRGKKDGRRIWDAGSASRSPYGKTRTSER